MKVQSGINDAVTFKVTNLVTEKRGCAKVTAEESEMLKLMAGYVSVCLTQQKTEYMRQVSSTWQLSFSVSLKINS